MLGKQSQSSQGALPSQQISPSPAFVVPVFSSHSLGLGVSNTTPPECTLPRPRVAPEDFPRKCRRGFAALGTQPQAETRQTHTGRGLGASPSSLCASCDATESAGEPGLDVSLAASPFPPLKGAVPVRQIRSGPPCPAASEGFLLTGGGVSKSGEWTRTPAVEGSFFPSHPCSYGGE